MGGASVPSEGGVGSVKEVEFELLSEKSFEENIVTLR